MGNTSCCQDTQEYNSPIPHFSDNPQSNNHKIQPTSWPQDDQVLTSIIQYSQYKQGPVYKRKDIDLYYAGQTQGGNIPDGKGLMYFKKKFLYQGHFREGQADGSGKAYLYEKNSSYEGYFSKSRAQGKGIFKNISQKYQFQGEWLESRPLKGKITFEDDPQIVVQIDDAQTNDATIRYCDGNVYKGQVDIVTYLPNGFGYFFTKDGKKSYSGQWNKGKMHGHGKFQWKQNNLTIQSYDGNYQNGKRKGIGKYQFKSGNVYQGQFQNDHRNGYGKLLDCHGKIIMEGQWLNQIFLRQLDNVSELLKKKRLSMVPQRDSQYNPHSQGKKNSINDYMRESDKKNLEQHQQNYTQMKEKYHNYQRQDYGKLQDRNNELKTNIKYEQQNKVNQKIHQDTPFPGFHNQFYNSQAKKF